MTKTPDEIKKGLECCTSRDCGGSKCPYFNEKSCNAAKSADALAFIQQIETKAPRWISVEERLPENDEAVLVHVKNKSRFDWMEIDILSDDGWVENADSDMHTVTHWMPLPEPPKEPEA